MAPSADEPNPSKARPDWSANWTSNATTAAIAAAISCTGSTYPPDITTGGPGQRFITGTAHQQCSGHPAFVQELCAKIQRNTGGADPSWIDVTNWQCNDNTGPSIYATATRDCALAAYALYRTAARGTATPVGLPTQRRYGYSSGRWHCT